MNGNKSTRYFVHISQPLACVSTKPVQYVVMYELLSGLVIHETVMASTMIYTFCKY